MLRAPSGAFDMTDAVMPGRLKQRSQFKAAAAGGRYHTKRMTLQSRVHENDEAGAGLQCGLTVTRKVGHAVVRNRIRRRLRSALRQLTHDVVVFDADVVVVARRDAINAPFKLLVDDLTIGLTKMARTHRNASPSSGPRGTFRLSSDASAQIT
jgi:ribonuclease P protein component